jgi:carboxylate-amine ligase
MESRNTRSSDGGGGDPFSIGIEEEMFLVDADTLSCVTEMPPAFREEAQRRLGPHFSLEMVPCIVELVSGCHTSIDAIAAELAGLRRGLGEIADRHGLALLACGTHPFSDWWDQSPTAAPRYATLADSVQISSLRTLACGMHVHVGVPDPRQRFAVLNRVQTHLPVLLALSASSPFWRGRQTGMASYRTAVNNELPRSGLPGHFESEETYARYIAAMTSSGLMPDETYVWWAVRPSARYPTVEVRVADTCTRLEDTIAIAAMTRALVKTLAEHRGSEPEVGSHLCNTENLWQAARHGCAARLLDPALETARPIPEHLLSLVQTVYEAAAGLGSLEQVTSCLSIPSRGTSAEHQVAIYLGALAQGRNEEEALKAAAGFIRETTLHLPAARSEQRQAQPSMA